MEKAGTGDGVIYPKSTPNPNRGKINEIHTKIDKLKKESLNLAKCLELIENCECNNVKISINDLLLSNLDKRLELNEELSKLGCNYEM